MECFCKPWAFSKGGGLFSGASVWGLTVAGGCMAVSPGLGAVLGLNLFVGTALFLFSTAFSFLTLGFVSGGGPVLTTRGAEALDPFFLQPPGRSSFS